MAIFKLLGNVRLPHHKKTAGMAAVIMPPPKEVLIPMAQHIGAPSIPVVKVGDEVKVGQKIGDAQGGVSSYIYAILRLILLFFFLVMLCLCGKKLEVFTPLLHQFLMVTDLGDLSAAKHDDLIRNRGA